MRTQAPEAVAVVQQFVREHSQLRAKFSAMIAAATLWPESDWVIRDLGFSLLRQLESHSQREVRLATACYLALGRAGSSELQRLAVDHSSECRALRDINQFLVKPVHGMPHAFSQLVQQASQECSRQIALQQERLFPLLECVLRSQNSQAGNRGDYARLDNAMTGNEIVQCFPAARAVFERLCVDIGLEGFYSIAEIAGRRGMQGRQFIAELKRGIQAV